MRTITQRVVLRARSMLLLLTSLGLVLAACADDSSVDTTTSSPTASTIGQTTTTGTPDTTTTIPSTTTTVEVWADTAVAEGLIQAVFAEDDAAIENAPSVSNRAKADATQRRDFSRAVNGVLVEATCEIADPALVTCVVVGADDISSALGTDSYTEQWDFDFNSEWILDFRANETDDEYGAFFGWAFDTYPNICDTPAQCALALLDITGEYLLTPAGMIGAYVSAYNSADIDAIVQLFADDAVIANHPGGTFTGKEQIRSLHEEEADGTVMYAISNVEVDGSTVTWDHVWSGLEDNGDPFENCVDGHSANVENGQILSWTWPPTDFEC